jgi:dihydrolipoamide dehydrogenase
LTARQRRDLARFEKADYSHVMPDFDYQLVVIGSGPGGYIAAIRASQLGLKTAIVEKDKTLGGTCLNVGCIPSKALLASTEHLHFAKERFAAHGIITGDIKVDLGTMMKRKSEVVGKLTGGVAYLMKKNKIEVVPGLGRLVDGHTVEVTGDGGAKRTLKTQNILLATGSVPIELPFLKYDGRRVINSDQAIALESVPKKLLVIGAGAIGLELGSVWARLGAEVTVIEFLSRVAAVGFDAETSKILQRSLEKLGMKFELSTKIESARVTDQGVELQGVQGDKKVSFSGDLVLVSVGRKPFTAGLDLEKAGVKLTDRGRIAINAHWQTSVPSIYSIGDVVDGPMLAHKAHEEGVAVAEHLAGKPGHVNYGIIPGIIYTAPEAASVGLTEDEAREKKLDVRVGKFNFTANGRAIANDTTDGFAKIIADRKTDKVLGAHIVASCASELIAETVLLMEFGGSSEDLARAIHAHPTMSEAVKEAALAVDGRMLSA